MSRLRGNRMARIVLGLAVLTVGFIAVGALTSGVMPTTHATCMARTDCTVNSPYVYCSDGNTYANICVAQAACQYACCEPQNNPHCHGGDPE